MAEFEANKAARVREVCRQLKPLIGKRAERIWLAYVAENEEGKEQIQSYLELMAAQSFQGTLDKDGPGLVPPRPEQARGKYELGTVVYNGRPLGPFGLCEQEIMEHVGIFGRSGAGKTTFGLHLVEQLVKAGKPVLILDFKRNYRDLLALPGFEQMAVYTIGRTVASLSFNPLIPPPGTSPQTWLKKLIAVTSHAYLLGDGVAYLLQEAIDQVYQAFGVYDGSVQLWPTFGDVLAVLKDRKVMGREAGWMASALRALASLCFGEMDTLVNQGHHRIEKLLTRPVILELDALTQSDKVFVASCIIQYVHHLRMAEPEREILKSVIVIEEAHHILTGERQSLAGGQSVMELAFREIREGGTGIVFLDQMPSTISGPALANSYALVTFNIKHKADVNAIGQAMLLKEEERSILGELQVGEAVVRLQGRSVKPFKILVPEFPIHKGVFTDAKVAEHMARLGLATPGEMAINAALAPAQAVQPPVCCTNIEAVFLKDVVDFPQKGIAERYRGLGLSVRQGQKLKQLLAEKGLIAEELETTPRGRVRVIRLTEQGRQLKADLAA